MAIMKYLYKYKRYHKELNLSGKINYPILIIIVEIQIIAPTTNAEP